MAPTKLFQINWGTSNKEGDANAPSMMLNRKTNGTPNSLRNFKIFGVISPKSTAINVWKRRKLFRSTLAQGLTQQSGGRKKTKLKVAGGSSSFDGT
jgi:hypothetical protein